MEVQWNNGLAVPAKRWREYASRAADRWCARPDVPFWRKRASHWAQHASAIGSLTVAALSRDVGAGAILFAFKPDPLSGIETSPVGDAAVLKPVNVVLLAIQSPGFACRDLALFDPTIDPLCLPVLAPIDAILRAGGLRQGDEDDGSKTCDCALLKHRFLARLMVTMRRDDPKIAGAPERQLSSDLGATMRYKTPRLEELYCSPTTRENGTKTDMRLDASRSVTMVSQSEGVKPSQFGWNYRRGRFTILPRLVFAIFLEIFGTTLYVAHSYATTAAQFGVV